MSINKSLKQRESFMAVQSTRLTVLNLSNKKMSTVSWSVELPSSQNLKQLLIQSKTKEILKSIRLIHQKTKFDSLTK